MGMDDQANGPAAPRRAAPRGRAFQCAALALAVASFSTTGFLMLHWLRDPEAAAPPAGAAPAARSRLYQAWPQSRKPDVVLLLSGEQYGYIQPCGCSRPQFGGLERRYNFLQQLTKQRGWPVVALDLGDLGDIARRGGPQTRLKYKYSMEALKQLGYTAVGVGQNEMAMPLLDALATYSLNEKTPRVLAANLKNKDQLFPEMVGSWEVVARKGQPSVGVVGVVGPTVAKQINDPDAQFASVKAVLAGEEGKNNGLLNQIKAKRPDLLVLLYQGTIEEAKACASVFKEFHVILCLTREEEPPEKAERVGQTMIVGVGHKGRHVGTVGVYRTGRANQPFELFYQLVPLGEEYETPDGKDATNPVLALLDSYTQEVKRGNYLEHYGKTKHAIQLDPAYVEATYVGSEKCKSCHEESYRIWKESPHSHAFASLVTAKRPALRQFDGECVRCHVTGFDHVGGYKNEAETPHLRENGCENCHGPGSLHVKNQNRNITDGKLNALMNPFKEPPNESPEARAKRMNRLDQDCQRCHDVDNDVNWNIRKWTEGKIVHKEPKDE